MMMSAVVAFSALGTAGADGQVMIAPGEGAIDVPAPAAPEGDVQVGLAADQLLTPEAAARQQIEQMAAQYEPLLQRSFYSHLELLRSLHGDLPVESRRAIAKAGEEAVKTAALRLSESLHGLREVAVAQGRREGILAAVGRALGLELQPDAPVPPTDDKAPDGGPFPDPMQILVDAIRESLVEQIGEEHAVAFVDELAERERRQRQATIRRLVGLLDDDLYLSAKQRRALEEALAADWEEGIAMAADQQSEINGLKIYLGLPYERVLPHLSPAQQAKLGDWKQAREMFGNNWQSNRQTRFFRQVNRSQQTELDPWWFE